MIPTQSMEHRRSETLFPIILGRVENRLKDREKDREKDVEKGVPGLKTCWKVRKWSR